MSDRNSADRNDHDNGCDNDSDNDSDDSYEAYHAWELEALARVPSLPREIQNHIVTLCEFEELRVLYKLNKWWHARALPLLWRDIDFPEIHNDDDEGNASRHFFARCDKMMDDEPERFATLASQVRTLKLGRLYGINVVHEGCNPDSYDYFDRPDDANARSVFDVIARFTNLETLWFYVKNYWDFNGPGGSRSTYDSLVAGLGNLKSLRIGGQLPRLVIKGLLQDRLGLEDLSVVNLHESPGQDYGPYSEASLSNWVRGSLGSLETLHLCKLADLDGRASNGRDHSDETDDPLDEEEEDEDDDQPRGGRSASGMRWGFPRHNEAEVLEDWAKLLSLASKTLRELTLENRWLCSYGWSNYGGETIVPGDGEHPSDYGAHSIGACQRVLFPALFHNEYPKLEKLMMRGMGKEEDVAAGVAHFPERVRVEQRPGKFVLIMGDVTPEQVSTPQEFLNDFWSDGAVSENAGSVGDEDGGSDGDSDENASQGS